MPLPSYDSSPWLSRLVTGLIVAAILAVCAAGAEAVLTDREETQERAATTGANMLALLEAGLVRTIRDHDASLNAILDVLNDENFASLPRSAQRHLLFELTGDVNSLTAIFVLDEFGQVTFDAAPTRRRGAFATADYFSVHMQRPQTGLYISAPFISANGEGEPSVAMSRRVNGYQGEFKGAVVAILRLRHFEELLSRLRLGPQDAINIFLDDGRLLYRHPFSREVLGKDLSQSPVIQRFLKEGASGFVGAASIDGVERFYTFTRAAGLPLFMNVALARPQYMAPWRDRTVGVIIRTLVLCTALFGVLWLLHRERTRRIEVERRLSDIATTDGLTGLANRRLFDERLAIETKEAARKGTPLSLLFADVDFFKQYNDRYGHDRGDHVLQAVASALLARSARPRDLAVRYGGEEFVVLLPETDAAGACAVAEEIRLAVRSLEIPHAGSALGTCSISIGVAQSDPSEPLSAQALVSSADAALYKAKGAGRDRVEVWDGATQAAPSGQ